MGNTQKDFAKVAGVFFILALLSKLIVGFAAFGTVTFQDILLCFSFIYLTVMLFWKGKYGKLYIAAGLAAIAVISALSFSDILRYFSSGRSYSTYYAVGLLLFLTGLVFSAILAFIPNKEKSVYMIDYNPLVLWWAFSALFFVVGLAFEITMYGGNFQKNHYFSSLIYCISDFFLLFAVFFAVRVTIDTSSNEDPNKTEEKKKMAKKALIITLVVFLILLIAVLLLSGIGGSNGSRSAVCNYCHGSGRVSGEKCPWCNGSGRTYNNYFNDILY